ncbi:hypothetical protein BAUCODRAFT_26240 [Baudoinia panamericana UAMH 10762]|uniref:Uncharacterized protein n=1 Tax=Baudoinia panamericana (strain UAMH 10762) TaxID=717646 RepID=M2MRE3_BAUPA|nr:uncharacterized protein BAUCODRAFT_26240 [Baudoinia panamericana UAMH 10762]EMC94018.1 hypothetical protein BAUCODRAFT_26240 [Baudoinia panamericana UAMH 10762]
MASQHVHTWLIQSGSNPAILQSHLLPQSKRLTSIATLTDDSDVLNFLTLLYKHQLCKVPWENLTQHYSWHRTVNVKPQHLFTKIVHSPGRGGYCMEANHFFHTVLISLGFDVRMAGARIYKGESFYGGWTHVVNIVTIAGTKYLLDGGFGPQAPPRPCLVEEGLVQTQIAPAQMRVMYECIDEFRDKTQRIWIYQHRKDDHSDWQPMYCFSDMEFTSNDVQAMNFAPWLNPQSFFSHQVVGVRFTTDKEPLEYPRSPDAQALEGEIDGALTLDGNTLKWRRGGEKVLDLTFEKEEQRVEALGKYFGIVLEEEDREAIKGTAAEVAAKGVKG